MYGGSCKTYGQIECVFFSGLSFPGVALSDTQPWNATIESGSRSRTQARILGNRAAREGCVSRVHSPE